MKTYRVSLMGVDGSEWMSETFAKQALAFRFAADVSIANGHRPIYLEDVHDEGPEDKGMVVIIETIDRG